MSGHFTSASADVKWCKIQLVCLRFKLLIIRGCLRHYDDVIMGAIASQITSLTIVYSTVYSDADQRKHQSSTSLAFVRGIHRGPVNSPHKWAVTRKMFPFDDVIMGTGIYTVLISDFRCERDHAVIVWKMYGRLKYFVLKCCTVRYSCCLWSARNELISSEHMQVCI